MAYYQVLWDLDKDGADPALQPEAEWWIEGTDDPQYPMGYQPPLCDDGLPPTNFPFEIGVSVVKDRMTVSKYEWHRCRVTARGSFHVVLDLYELGDKISLFKRDIGRLCKYPMRMDYDTTCAVFSMRDAGMLKPNILK